MNECAVGIEVSHDRRHASVATASALPDGTTYVDLVGYLDGTADVVDSVRAIAERAKVVALVVDAGSPTRSLIAPLEQAGHKVQTLAGPDVAVAHALVRDELAARRLRHSGAVQLEAAVRAADTRPVGGQEGWQRRTAVDLSPLSAVSLATYGWLRRTVTVEPWCMWRDDFAPARTPVDVEPVFVMGAPLGYGGTVHVEPLPERGWLPGGRQVEG